MKYKIIVDSACDVYEDYIIDENVGFSIVPFLIHVGDKTFIDDESLDTNVLLNTINQSRHRPTSSCPNPYSFEDKFSDAENIFIVTISSKLSGSYNSAVLASNEFNGKNIFVIDSKATSGVMIKIIDELYSLIKQNLSFEEIKDRIIKFRDSRKLYFVLDKFDNLINNGRLSKGLAILCKLLKIKLLCEAHEGEIKLSSKVRTRTGVIKTLIENTCKASEITNYGDCVVTHCQDEETANYIVSELKISSKFKKVRSLKMRGLCSFYALTKGIIVSF